MDLTRRDALAALAVVGAGGAVAGLAETGTFDGGTPGTSETGDESTLAGVDALDTLTAASEVLYPSEATGHREFVETYVLGRIDGREAYETGLAETLAELDATARDWYDAAFADLTPADRDELLRQLGTDTADPDPDGPLTERVRYYVVNELLFAFYASPTGGGLVGTENPIGYPGGTESYQRGPNDG
ncbi:gluconate 2-dehydrogenase subunit 3 family protein [Salinirubrum litoreum]|uniref:Gluconate 2-dehydrogenase subunit 3 family protein n=1 Tax=Salinirubrum litoreum TaxID=1126234 RepID=A0ABD5R7R8_9EURY|nr:gluconate 2-dehydrogenase subunit 3 family protein [Salinirubrum litoreum]